MTVNPQATAAGTEATGLQAVIKKNVESTFNAPTGFAATASPPTFCGKADSTRFGLVKFGMERSPQAGCCITRFTGGKSGCCAGIKSGKPFEREYIKAVERDIKTKGEMPQLEPKVIEKLKELKENSISEFDRLQAIAKTYAKETPKVKASDDKLSSSDLKLLKVKNKFIAFIQAPFRWVKWLAIGFWADLKQIVAGRRA
jgi:hypothetical protein